MQYIDRGFLRTEPVGAIAPIGPVLTPTLSPYHRRFSVFSIALFYVCRSSDNMRSMRPMHSGMLSAI